MGMGQVQTLVLLPTVPTNCELLLAIIHFIDREYFTHCHLDAFAASAISVHLFIGPSFPTMPHLSIFPLCPIFAYAHLTTVTTLTHAHARRREQKLADKRATLDGLMRLQSARESGELTDRAFERRIELAEVRKGVDVRCVVECVCGEWV